MKSRDIYAVVTTYSFSPDVTVRLYPTEDAAKAALINMAKEECRIDVEENGWKDTELVIDPCQCCATLTNHFSSGPDVTTWTLADDVIDTIQPAKIRLKKIKETERSKPKHN